MPPHPAPLSPLLLLAAALLPQQGASAARCSIPSPREGLRRDTCGAHSHEEPAGWSNRSACAAVGCCWDDMNNWCWHDVPLVPDGHFVQLLCKDGGCTDCVNVTLPLDACLAGSPHGIPPCTKVESMHDVSAGGTVLEINTQQNCTCDPAARGGTGCGNSSCAGTADFSAVMCDGSCKPADQRAVAAGAPPYVSYLCAKPAATPLPFARRV